MNQTINNIGHIKDGIHNLLTLYTEYFKLFLKLIMKVNVTIVVIYNTITPIAK